MNILNRFITVFGYLLGIISIGFLISFYFSTDTLFGSSFRIRGISNLFGAIGVAVGIAAVSVWIIRKLYIEIKKRKIPDFELTRTTLLFFRKHHMLLGWLTILVATTHGIYYILIYPNRAFQTYTGLTTWLFLAILAGMGAILDYRQKEKKKSKGTRWYHILLAVIFLVGLVIHTM